MNIFNTEREMQNKFVKVLESNSDKDIFEEVGNSNFHFRVDVLEYSKNETKAFELKLNDFKKLIEQCFKHIYHYRFNRVYAVIPEDKYEKFLNKCNHNFYTDKRFGIITFDGKNIKIRKQSKKQKVETLKKFEIADLIVRGYHMNGKNCRKNYK